MKKLIFTSLIITSTLFLINTNLASAHGGSMMDTDNNNETKAVPETDHVESVEVILQGLLKQQNVSTVQKLDLSKISDHSWEELGDAVMELQHPGKAHESMDQMMGGEGSESLKQMHINMGKAYLGYGNNTSHGAGMMTNGSMMGYGNNNNFTAPTGMVGYSSMMGYGGYGIFGIITWIMTIAFLTSGIYFFIRKAHKK